MLTIVNHKLVGPKVTFQQTPNAGGVISPKGIVWHYTGADNAKGSVSWLCNRTAKVSAHLVLAQDGSIVQLAPFNVKTWHAGPSKWGKFSMLNGHFIGIEMANCGPLKKMADGSYRAELGGTKFAAKDVVLAAHKFTPKVERAWDDYPAAQLERAFELMAVLTATYKIPAANQTGHDDVCIPKGRKVDPGPAFPLEKLKARAYGRQ